MERKLTNTSAHARRGEERTSSLTKQRQTKRKSSLAARVLLQNDDENRAHKIDFDLPSIRLIRGDSVVYKRKYCAQEEE